MQIEKSQGEIYRLRAKLESTQTENENLQEEFEKMQQALNRSYADRDKIVSDLDKLREDLERSQVRLCPCISSFLFITLLLYREGLKERNLYAPLRIYLSISFLSSFSLSCEYKRHRLGNTNCNRRRPSKRWTKRSPTSTAFRRNSKGRRMKLAG